MSLRKNATSERDDHKSPHELIALERNLTSKPAHGGDLRIHLVYPNHYWVAMSNLGYQAVYALFAGQAGVAVERGFLPAPEQNSEEQTPQKTHAWRSFESSKPLRSCDVLAFSLSFETDYPHLLKILNNQGLLTRSPDERLAWSDEHAFGAPLILVGGTAATLNPEPIADFVDVVFLGEAEEFVPEFVAVLRESQERGERRIDLLRRLSRIPGIYVPRFFSTQFNADGTVRSFHNELGGEQTRPQRRFVKDISQYPTYTRILTPQTEFRSMFLTETGRGCEMGCRFCVAGYIYRPVRKRSEQAIRDTVQIGRAASDAIGFVGAAVSSHRAIAKLTHEVASSGARASLSSLMAQKVTPELAHSLSESEYKTVALAPEAGSDRLRFATGKRVGNDQFVVAALELARGGIRGFKLYFMVGLPTEQEEDVDAIAELATIVRDGVVELARVRGKTAWVTLSVNPFIPKACTPFQWEPMIGRKELERKIDRVRQRICRVSNLEMNFESPRESYFQALLSRGDRRVGLLLLEAEQRGKDWRWLVQQSKREVVPGVPPMDFYITRRFGYNELLPWEVVDSRIDKKLLMREAERAWTPEAEDEQYAGDENVTSLSALT